MSSLYPDRPIRPLPKRRLRERLSQEVVDSIQYPPAPESASSLFYYPYDQEGPSSGKASGDGAVDRARVFRKSGMSASTDSEEEEAPRTVAVPWPSPQVGARMARRDGPAQHPATGNPEASTISSVDGYDPLENTNNKKKRKIPSPGDHMLNGGNTLAEIGNLSISHRSGHDSLDGASSSAGHYAISSSQGMSGPGRGRFGRSRPGRSPLRTLSDSCSNWAGRGAKFRPLLFSQQPGDIAPPEGGAGIISNAIANAGRLPPAPNQENISLLQQADSTQASPGSSLFTFTCESTVNSSIAWPVSDTASSSIQSPSSKSSTAHHMQSTQTSPPRTGSAFDRKPAVHPGGDIPEPVAEQQHRPKTEAEERRALKREIQKQADKRKREHRKERRSGRYNGGDWLCLFCEYEMIFGAPPRSLIEKFELKEREKERQEQEKNRLLEKARSRARKNRKAAGKTSGKGRNAGRHQSQQSNEAPYDHHDPHDHPDDATEDMFEDDDDGQADYVDHGAQEVLEEETGARRKDRYPNTRVYAHGSLHENPAARGGGVAGGGGSSGGHKGIHHHPPQTCTCAHA